MLSGRGRPLRFLVVVLGGWTAARVAILWPEVETPRDAVRAVVPFAQVMPRAGHGPVAASRTIQASAGSWPRAREPVERMRLRPWALPGAEAPLRPRYGKVDPDRVVLAMFALIRIGDPVVIDPPGFGAPPLLTPPATLRRSRWSGSAWLLARGDGGRAATGGPVLGASQAGVRIAYALNATVAAVGRVSTPLGARGREAALGVEWRPTRLPVRLVAEVRHPLDGGGRAAPVIGAIGGIGPQPLAAGFALDGYAQAGAISRAGVSGFVDAIARVTRPVAMLGRVTLDAGAGGWASAQRGAARLDIGPTLGATIPVAARAVRLSLDYRQRLAGDARPGSGLALTIGADF